MHSRPLDASNTHRQHRIERGLQISPHTLTVADNAGGKDDDDDGGGAHIDYEGEEMLL